MSYPTNANTGDLLAFSEPGIFAWLIRLWTQSEISHVGMLYWDCGTHELMLVQATPDKGVEPILSSRALAEHSGKVWWVALKGELAVEKNPNYQQALVKFLTSRFGDGYDFRGIAHFVLPFIKAQKSREYCSELVAEAYRAAGLLTRTQLSPGQLVSLSLFQSPVLLS